MISMLDKLVHMIEEFAKKYNIPSDECAEFALEFSKFYLKVYNDFKEVILK